MCNHMTRTSITSLSPLMLLLLFTTVSIVAAELRRVCYFTNWSQYRNGKGKFLPSNLDAHLCTHICFAFATINNNMLSDVEWNDILLPPAKGLYEQVNDLKQNNPQLKTLLSVGGWRMGSMKFSEMVATVDTREEFITNAIVFLRKWSFDGLDIDWEYPGGRGSPVIDKQRYAQFFKECYQAFESESKRTGKPRLLLTCAVPAGKAKIDAGYDIKSLHPYVEFFNVMTYDYHGTWERKTGHNSPFEASSSDSGESANLNGVWTMNYWMDQGAPASKLNFGLPLFGRSFTLDDPNINGLLAPASLPGKPGEFTGEAGILAYYEICQMINDGATVKRLTDEKVPYLVKGNQWVGYDDQESLYLKASWAKQFGGIFVWAIDLDDFNSVCPNGERYTLMNTIIRALKGQLETIPSTIETTTIKTDDIETTTIKTDAIETTTIKTDAIKTDAIETTTIKTDAIETTTIKTDAIETTTIKTDAIKTDDIETDAIETDAIETTTIKTDAIKTDAIETANSKLTSTTQASTDPGFEDNFCVGKSDNFYAVPQHCSYFYQCSHGNTYLHQCAPGTVFNSNINVCDYSYNVPGCE